MNQNLKSLTVRGLKWSSLSQFTRQVLQYISTVILVGILSPIDFGLMAIAIVAISFLDVFKDLGTGAALIQVEEPSDTLKSSVFWINCGFGIIITFIIYSTAPIFSSFFGNEKIADILQVLSFTFLLSGISITQKSLLEKTLSFKNLSIVEFISSAVSFSVGIILAILGFGVWSLVFQSLANSFSYSVLIWIISKWKPAFKFNFSEVKSITHYSINLIGFNTINYLSRNADYFLIGKFLGDNSLGHYYLAYKIMLYPLQNISTVISRVLFPSFSRIQNDNPKFQSTYLKLTKSIALITFPMMAGIALVSNEFVLSFFSREWDYSLIALLIMILAPVGAMQSIISTVGNIYQAKGKTDLMFKWAVFAGTITISGFVIGVKWGVIGVALSYLITNLILVYPAFHIPFKLIELKPHLFFKSFTNTLIATTFMLIFIFIISFLIADLNHIVRLLILTISGIGIYIIYSFNKNKLIISDLKELFPGFVAVKKNLTK